MVTPAHCRNYFKKSPFFLPRAAPDHLPRTLYTPSAQDLGHFPARQVAGIPFRAGNDTFFCSEPPRSNFRAGFGAFFCPAGGRKFQQLSGSVKSVPECIVDAIFFSF